ncbi:MAG: hypothetical protein JEZ14_01000 [Marinilabiliaceae bacterium]|nr:hypothetical protein [Marinilabiliaceae bacterium]
MMNILRILILELKVLQKMIIFQVVALVAINNISIQAQIAKDQYNLNICKELYIDTLEHQPRVLNTEVIINKNFIVSCEWTDEDIFTLHDLNSKKYIGSFGKKKDFKDNFFYPEMQSTKDGFLVRDKKYLYKITYEILKGQVKYSIKPVFKFPLKRKTIVSWADQLSDSLFLFKVIDQLDNSIYFGKKSAKKKVRPLLSASNHFNTINEVNTLIRCKPDRSEIAILPKYNSNKFSIVTAEGEIVYDTHLEFLQHSKRGWLTLHYTKMYTTDAYIYGLYRNLTNRIGDYRFIPGDVYELHIWDWKGNSINQFQLPERIDNIVVTNDDSVILGVSDQQGMWILYGFDGKSLCK